MPLDPVTPDRRASNSRAVSNNWWRPALILGLVLLFFGAAAYSYHVYSQSQGRVISVTPSNWQQEVAGLKDYKPVMIYFHSSGSPARQAAIVQNFARRHAREVQVVSINLNLPQNQALAARFKVVRHPAFVVVYKSRFVKRDDGIPANYWELRRLILLALGKIPMPIRASSTHSTMPPSA